MPSAQKLDTHHKALTLNLDTSKFGSFAEIGAGQEVARWFLLVGAASGTVAKTISAYDKEVSDDLYGSGSRYVSKAAARRDAGQRMDPTSHAIGQNPRAANPVLLLCRYRLRAQLRRNQRPPWLDGPPVSVAARRSSQRHPAAHQYARSFQCPPAGSHRNSGRQSHLRRVLRIANQGIISGKPGTRRRQGANRDRLRGSSRAGIRELGSPGPAGPPGSAGFAEAVFFPSKGSAVPPTEILYKKAVVLAPGYFGHTDADHASVHARLLASGIQQLQKELGETKSAPAGFFCLTAASFTPNEPAPEIPDLIRRIDALLPPAATCCFFANPSSTT